VKSPRFCLETHSPDLATWTRHRVSVVEEIGSILGHLPVLPGRVQGEVLSRREHPLGVVEKIRLSNGSNVGIPAWFAFPKQKTGPGPAVLWCHWHGGEYKTGKGELFENNHTPEPPIECFLQRGCSVLCIDAYGFGERNGKDPESCQDLDQEGEQSLFKHFLWQGSSLWGRMVWDDRLAFRYLQQRDEVDGDRIAVAGMSMGSTRAQWLMAFEERAAMCVGIACMVRYRELIASKGLRRHGLYFFVPGLMEYCDLEVILALAAPRPLLCLNGGSDLLSPRRGMEKAGMLTAGVYNRCGKPEAFRNEIFEGVGHVCTPESWQIAMHWIERL
jgi:dienelactone hydrolase